MVVFLLYLIGDSLSTFIVLDQNDNFTNDIHVSDLSKMAHLCPDHYTRLFKANMNSTPYQYLMSLRLNRALALKDQGIGGEELLKLTGFRNLDSLQRAVRRGRSERDPEI